MSSAKAPLDQNTQAQERLGGDRSLAEEYAPGSDRPLGGYAALMGLYSAGVTAGAVALRRPPGHALDRLGLRLAGVGRFPSFRFRLGGTTGTRLMLGPVGGRSVGFARFVRSGVLKKQGKECRQGQETLEPFDRRHICRFGGIRTCGEELGQKFRNTSPRHDVVPVPPRKICF